EHGEKEREFYTLEDFIELFDTENLNKSNPVFNRDKLVWFNQKYIHMLKPDQFVLTFTQWLENYGDDTDLKNSIIEHGPDYLESSLVLVQERCKVLSELPDLISPFYTYPEKSAVYKVVETTKQTNKLDKSTIDSFVSAFCSELEQQSSVKKWGHESWETFVRTYAESNELKAGQLFMTLRIVILGTPFSPPLFESMEVLEKETILERLA
ncbi:hypothetical protein KC717_02485, partial [Candidatus Dojkabacteria bacterium]|nr:hypothetical protein [Candidatus Dojkabacteria bacterium]